MAEAAVEERPPQKFYCHMCNVQFENASANFTCPHCADGFIEELQESPDSRNPTIDIDDDDDSSDMDFNELLLAPTNMEDFRTGRSRAPDGHRTTGRRYAVNRARIVRPRTLTRLASSNLRQNVPFENLIQDFIVNLGVGLNWGAAGNMQLFLGNPGDYAWGREGLDAIVTQLLNQMDSTGPPPVSKEVIDALPVINVKSDQVDAKLQCSVCWEDFQLGENVRQLPCTHIYHEPCIRPWLELHGTCPICRQNLVNDEQSNSDSNQDSGGSSTGGQDTLNAIRNILQPAHNTSSNLENSRPTHSRSDFM
ncbi:E3 ubiquitin-protein ligase Iruka isoform X1 [Tribolium castaneum]|uniref:RING-type E3 ubiquitin transferase n=1 Tax=Tribolium castaneum TaxID=7070 RepID=A0A139WAP3_TRICA|nr:PREDICTED: E3 ubiquitin-protein ligase RNF126 isoform X1 [Tribolium castaneum]KYB24961.1 E3 ubiquitin-protein ligase RNF126-like Protein [Tribolium castaneum]|eukprot:XP_008198902.1 PREDICTED: E3 ubiquitin-protein ligase RNF126 isoform X1 [Tribolium castaneum]